MRTKEHRAHIRSVCLYIYKRNYGDSGRDGVDDYIKKNNVNEDDSVMLLRILKIVVVLLNMNGTP